MAGRLWGSKRQPPQRSGTPRRVRRLWHDPVVAGLALAAAFSWWLFVFGGVAALPAWWAAARDAWTQLAGRPAPDAPTPADATLAAVVNGEAIPMAELEQRTALHLAYFRLGGGTAATYADIRPQIMLDVLREMIDERLVRQEMRRRRAAPRVAEAEVDARLRDEVERRRGAEAQLREELRQAGLSLDYARQVLHGKLASEKLTEQVVLRRVPPDEQPLAYYDFLADLRGQAQVVVRYSGETTR